MSLKKSEHTLYYGMRKPMDFKGQKFGKLLVIRRVEDKMNCNGNPVIQWECRCECGDTVIRRSFHLRRGRCSCHKCKAIEDAKKYGYKDIRTHHWYNIKKQADKRGLDFDITMEYAWQIYESQNGKCALTGMDIGFAKNKKDHATGGTTASLDRIDSLNGYVCGNVQWLHKWINVIKWDFSQQEFIGMCKMVAEYNDQNKTSSQNSRWQELLGKMAN